MRSPRSAPSSTTAKQLTASDPLVSAWVSANAGSGKTTVLTRRVIRLLLDGVAPAAILCLTFTKAAAANMQNRIFETLGQWAALDDGRLLKAIEELSGRAPDATGLVRARRLFASAVETPGGLKILTIHAFCERVLHLFPFEANVPAQFTVLEERGAEELIERARQAVILDANSDPGGPLGRAMARIVEEAGEEAFDTLISEVTARREAIRAMLRDSDVAVISTRLTRLLELAPGETVAAIEQAMDAFGLAPSEWPGIAAELGASGEKKMADMAGQFLAAHAARGNNRSQAYRGIFLTEGGEARKAERFLNKAITREAPRLAGQLLAELARIGALADRRKLAAAAERTQALLVVAEALIERYEAGKRARAALDFDDLVGRTRALLVRAGAEWVLYKLDRGIDHMLVDEAQDTSPEQWQIVRLLAHEFTAGAGARGPLTRTIFAVGDEKQSIFSFQGAAPAEFARMRNHFRAAFAQAGLAFEPIDLTHSFRSALDILKAVDIVFADPANRRGLSSDEVATLHETVRSGEPGGVEVWPVIKPDPAPDIEPWDAPFDETPNSSPTARSAARIAASLARLIQDGDAATGQRFTPGDVMVLVRSRNALFDAVIRALKREGVPVAGADRIVLTDHIAVMDLVAIARFTLLPADDLTLATVLKTPLIGLDDDDLIRLSPGRRGSLWNALREAGETEPRFAAAARRLQGLIDEAAFKTPFAFFSDILARDGGRRAFLQRLGPEAADALDEFLSASLDHQRSATPSLEGFLAWLAAARAEIKRDMDVARGEVRVMTVHGAKGLEAKIVILADTCTAPTGRHDPKVFFVADETAGAGSRLALWSPGKDYDPPAVAKARLLGRGEADQEYRRLLYVAMTRAEDRLIVTGHEGAKTRPTGTWYDMIERTLRAAGARPEPMPGGAGERLVFEVTPRVPVAAGTAPLASGVVVEPAWLRRAAPYEPIAASPLLPSGAAEGGTEAESAASARTADDSAAAERGRLVHRLLQSLPDIAPDARPDAARRFLARMAKAQVGEHEGLIGEVMAILDDQSFAAVFGAGSRAEVPLVGRLERAGGEDIVSGRIDRLCVFDDQILVVDFKTGRNPPGSLAEVPSAYVLQLALYRALLGRIYPGRAVRAALVFTATAKLMEMPAAMMDAARKDATTLPRA